MDILIFKTSIEGQKEVYKLTSHLALLEGVVEWNVDLADCDKVLRIVSSGITVQQIQSELTSIGICCEELD